MTSIKEKKQGSGKEFQLTEYEAQYIEALAKARNAAYTNYQQIISTFLAYLGGTKWGLGGDEMVDFSYDDAKRTVTVTPHKEPPVSFSGTNT